MVKRTALVAWNAGVPLPPHKGYARRPQQDKEMLKQVKLTQNKTAAVCGFIFISDNLSGFLNYVTDNIV